MRIDKETEFARMKVGYFEPPVDKRRCQFCGAVTKVGRKPAAPYYCRRHKFFVRKDGTCPDQSKEPYQPIPKQDELGGLFSKESQS